MSRVQIALNVDDLDRAIAFYSKLFDTEPAKVRPGYANFAIAEPPLKLVLLENAGHGGTLNHLGVEVESVAAWQIAAAGAGLPCIGLLSGGISRAELQAAGASSIFADPQDLLEHLEATRIAALAPSR
ncbi:MAG: VOC family protein [Mycobacterium sp.]